MCEAEKEVDTCVSVQTNSLHYWRLIVVPFWVYAFRFLKCVQQA